MLTQETANKYIKYDVPPFSSGTEKDTIGDMIVRYVVLKTA